jgi:hypothetical protein
MTETIDFQLAQIRLKDRQRKQSLLLLWLALFCTTIIMNVIFGGIVEWWVPLEIFTALMVVVKAIQLYYSSPRRSIRSELIEQEMDWLFGLDWREHTGPQEYTFAQDRIRKRRLERWLFALHLLAFVPISTFFLSGISFLASYGQPGGEICIAVPLTWLVFLLFPHGIRAFPTKEMLANREQRAGEALWLELQKMRPEKLKTKAKPKRDVKYVVGDDGELVEVELEETDEKSKRDQA